MKNKKRSVLVLLLFFCILLFVSCNPNNDEEMQLFNDHTIDMWAASLKPFSYDYAFFGDSRVAGADWVSEFDTYSVVNLGLGGDVVQGLVRRLKLIEAADVKCCFVAIGGNDCLASNFSSSKFEEQYYELVEGLENLSVETILTTIAPVTDKNSVLNEKRANKTNSRIKIANDIIFDIAEEYDLEIIDMAALMTDSDGKLKEEYSQDGAHFTFQGNTLWFDTVRPYLDLKKN